MLRVYPAGSALTTVLSGEELEEGEGMQIVLDEQGQERGVQYIEEEHSEYPGGTMEVAR